MVETNSLTTNVAGVQQVADQIAEAFAELGFAAELAPTDNPAHGSHLCLRRLPIVGAPTVALITHLDTVFSAEEELANDFRWREEGDRIYGPGTNDIKGGTAGIYLLLQVLRDANPALYHGVNWVVLANACEEVDSDDFGQYCCRTLPADTRACLLFEADGGTREKPLLVEARKGRAVFRIESAGRGAHAGSAHEQGANAITALAEVVVSLAQLTDYTAGLTVNVGVIAGGSVTNRVPHFAEAKLEMRAFDTGVYDQAKAGILAVAGQRMDCEISVAVLDEDQPWSPNPQSQNLLQLWQTAGAELGVPVASMTRGGLSDGNVLWRRFPTLDGLGPCGQNCHCSEHCPSLGKEQEWVDQASFVPKTILNALALSALVAGSA